jgi:L,D-transpeptidase YcbB
MSSGLSARRLTALMLTCSALALGAVAAQGADEVVVPQPATVAAVEATGVVPVPVVATPLAPAAEILTPGETPAAVSNEPPKPAEPTVVATPATAVRVSDPILIAVREQLAKPMSGVDKADTAALVAFYAARVDGPVWLKDGAFTPAAQSAMTTIKNADDWGLDPKAFLLPQVGTGGDVQTLADAEVMLSRAILKYARQASGGRIDPSTLSRVNDMRGTFANPAAVLSGIASTTKTDVYLEALHPAHPQFHKLQKALYKARHGAPEAALEVLVDSPKLSLAAGPALKPGAEHPDVALIRAYLKVPATAGEAVYDDTLVSAVKAFQEQHGLKQTGLLSSATRTALNGSSAGSDKGKKKLSAADPAREIERIVLNMERWRWMPTDMGRFHILNNVPEYVTRVYKDRQIVHQEKIIVGKSDTPTSVFSANMQFVIFHPEWGVPDSIKMKEILPSLRRKTSSGDDFFGLGPTVSDTRVLQRHNLRVSYNGKPVDASKIDWATTDPRAYSFIQPAGGTNVLGLVKFRFPNRHDIYMHDTPQRDLFSNTTRAFSHGCMRVHNPRRLAEVILAEDRGWTPEKVGSALAGSGSQEVKIDHPFPVHVAYLTARVDEDGKLQTFADLYGHDAKLASALSGRPVRLEEPTAVAGAEQLAQSGQKRPTRAMAQPKEKTAGLGGLLEGLFGN